MFSLKNTQLAIIGLGYVGLPLAIEFAKRFPVIGFDIKERRVRELQLGIDCTHEVTKEQIQDAKNLQFSTDCQEIANANIYIVTVPTPIDTHNQPDLTPLIKASEMIGQLLTPGDIVIYESTVYPGVTEDECVPILEGRSSLIFNKNFFVGYSPERVNPGDKTRVLSRITKVVSGSTPEVTKFIAELYSEIIVAGVYTTSSIKVAEAAKVIENTQRDVNIALINELSIIFNRLGISTSEVLAAAETKWNFLPFRPGLVGGHCIGVDPYYLTHKAQSVGYHPEIILAGRRLNDGMGQHIVAQLVKQMLKKRIFVDGAKVLILGLTFKENCPDIRNTKVIDLVTELREYNIFADVMDPRCSSETALLEYGLALICEPAEAFYDGIVLAVAHDEFKLMGYDYVRSLGKDNCVLYDLKNIFPEDHVDIRL